MIHIVGRHIASAVHYLPHFMENNCNREESPARMLGPHSRLSRGIPGPTVPRRMKSRTALPREPPRIIPGNYTRPGSRRAHLSFDLTNFRRMGVSYTKSERFSPNGRTLANAVRLDGTGESNFPVEVNVEELGSSWRPTTGSFRRNRGPDLTSGGRLPRSVQMACPHLLMPESIQNGLTIRARS